MYYKDTETLNSQLEKTESGSTGFHKNVDLILPRKGMCLGIYFRTLALCLMPPSSGQYKVRPPGVLGGPAQPSRLSLSCHSEPRTEDTVVDYSVSSRKIR